MPQATAQDVASTLGAQPDMTSMSQALNRYGRIQQAEETDPQIEKARQKLSETTEKATAEAGELQKKIELEGADLNKELEPWNADKEAAARTTPLMQQFGSAGSVFAILASAFTHRPMVNALMGSAAAMKAIQKGDADAYQRAYEAYKENTEEALRRHQLQMEEYKTQMELLTTQPSLAETELKVLTSKYDDKKMALLQQAGLFHDMVDLQIKREEVGVRLAEAHAKLVPYDILMQEVKDWKKDHNGIGPNGEQMAKMYADITMGVGLQTPETRQANAAQVATGQPLNQVIPGYGKSATAARAQAKADAIQLMMDENPGWTAARAGVELANRTVEFVAGRASVSQLQTMRGATVQAVQQLEFNVQQVNKEMKKLGSSDVSPVINAIARGEEYWTGNKAYAGLFYFMNAASVESARIISGGQGSRAQLHQGAMEEAKQWASINMTPASWAEVSSGMLAEGKNRIENYTVAIDSQLKGMTGAETDVGSFSPDPSWPSAQGLPDNKYLYDGGVAIAKSSHGQWVAP